MRISPIVLIIINDDFYENKPEGYPLQGAKSGNERKRAVTGKNIYYAQYSLIAGLDVAVISRRYLKLV